MAYNSDIPMLEAQKRADRDAANAGLIVSSWTGQEAMRDLQWKQQRDQFTPAPPYSPPSFPSPPPASPISYGSSSDLLTGTPAPATVDDPIQFCALAGALLMVMLALTTEGVSIATLVIFGVIGAAGGAVLGVAISAAIIIIAFLLKLVFWGAFILFVLQLFA